MHCNHDLDQNYLCIERLIAKNLGHKTIIDKENNLCSLILSL